MLAYNYAAKARAGELDKVRFWEARFTRLYPIYFLSLLLSWKVVPITWRNRDQGVSKLRLKEMGSRYLFIVLYCYLEKYLAREDYRKRLDLRDRQLQVWSR